MQAVATLYKSLFDQVDKISWPSCTTRNKAIGFLQSLVRKRNQENTTPLEFTDLAYNYYVLKLGTNYRSVIKPLLDQGVLESNRYYRPGYHDQDGYYIKGQCLSYRINPNLIDDELVQVKYQVKPKPQKCKDELTMGTKQILRQLRIPQLNSRKIIKFVKMSLTDQRIRAMIKVDEEISEAYITLKGTSYPQKRINIHLRNKSLIKDGKYCYVDHLDEFIRRKRRHLTQAYCDQLLRIKHRQVYADRNETNHRLDSNITNLKSSFLSLVTLDDQRLSSIDLKNSQFRFFVFLLEKAERKILLGSKFSNFPATKLSSVENAKITKTRKIEKEKEGEDKMETLLSVTMSKNCIKNVNGSLSLSGDYKRFKKLVKTGQLYEYLQQLHWQEMGIKINRKEAKQLMFKLAFSSHRYNPPGKKILRKEFPSIIQLIDDFKKSCIKQHRTEGIPPKEARDKGNASFAIMLQRVESQVFIDKILAACFKRKLKVLSKHDSILCRQCDRHVVTKIICRVLNQLFGKWTYSLDIDGKVFEIQPKRNTRMQRLVQTFVSTLFGMEYRANAPPSIRELHTPGQLSMSYKSKHVPSHVYNARAPRTTSAELRPLKSKRLEKLRERFWGE